MYFPLNSPRRTLAAISLAMGLLSAPPALAAAAAAPAAPAASQNILPLAGQWRFAMDRSDAGVTGNWPGTTLTDKINIPGVLQAQGYGDDISLDTPWVGPLGAQSWRTNPELSRFTEPGKVKVPFLAQPPKHYLGVAWYQRDIDVPASWSGKRVELFIERAHWQTTVWVDGQKFAPEDSLTTPHETDLHLLTPGKHQLTIRIDNRMIYTQRADGHSVSDSMGQTWNGMAGKIELRATSPVWIYDAQVFPDVAKKAAVINVTIGNDSGQNGQGTITIGGVTAPVTWTADGGAAQLTVPLAANAQTWDEYHPVLQHLTVNLKGTGADDQHEVTFGLRQISFEDKNLFFNGRLINLRATHFADEFPLTGYPATDVDSWKKIIQECKDYGLNALRFHSSCPPDAAFTAADELGFYIMGEAPFWDGFSPGSVNSRRLDEETVRMRRNYGNHPSFITMSASNESGGNYGPTWAAANYQADSRRLYATSTGNDNNLNLGPGVTYASMPHTSNITGGGGLLRLNNGGAQWAGGDYRAALVNVHIPIVSHEIGQLCAYPDFDQIKEFTGYMQPSSLEVFKASAAAHGLLDRNHEFSWASGKFQVLSYKQEFETNMRTPGLSGFQVLDLHDYLGQGSALVGVVDALWHPKSYVTAAEYARFAGPIVPLARLAKRVFLSNESLESDVELYQFGEGPLTAAVPYWKLVDLQGKTVQQGEWPARDLPIGKNLPLGHVAIDLSKLASPREYKLVVGVRGTKAENDWNIWVYPQAAAPDPQTAGVFETNDWAAAQDYLAKGGKVLYLPPATQLVNSTSLGSTPVFWNLQMNPRGTPMLGLWCDAAHPALAGFPTEGFCDLQWTPLVSGLHTINIEGAPAKLKPIVSAVDDWNRNWRLAIIFEVKVGTGRLLVSAVNFLTSRNPGAIQLQRSLLDYMATEKFQPALTLTPAEADKMWSGNPTNVVLPLGETPPEIDTVGNTPPAAQ